MKYQIKATGTQKGQKLRFSALFLCFAIFFSACSRGRSDLLKYKDVPFTSTVSVSGGRIDFEAIFSISAPDGVGERNFSAEFLAPESLKGLVVSQVGGEAKIALGDKEFLSAESEILRLLDIGKIAQMLAPDGAVRSIKSEGGLTAVTVGAITLYIDPVSAFPVRITDRASGIIVFIK